MFVLTAKLSKTKLIAAGLILLATVLLIVMLAISGGNKDNVLPKGGTNDERVSYLATYGWSVNAMPTESQKVKIPDTTENAVFSRYNDLQKSQGFDLTEYAGTEVMRYVYEILNYPDASEPVYASILVYDGHIIGGDITDTAADGLIHGFRSPQKNVTESHDEPAQESKSTETPPESTASDSGSIVP